MLCMSSTSAITKATGYEAIYGEHGEGASYGEGECRQNPASCAVPALGEQYAKGGEEAAHHVHSVSPSVRSVSPSLLAEIQAVTFPAAIWFAALTAKNIYFDQLLGVSAPASPYLAAGSLAAVAFSLIAGQTGIHSVSALVKGESQSPELAAAISMSFFLTLCFFYSFSAFDHHSWGWFALWYALGISFLLLERHAILI